MIFNSLAQHVNHLEKPRDKRHFSPLIVRPEMAPPPSPPASDTSEHIHTRVIAQDSLKKFKRKHMCCIVLVAERFVTFSSRKVEGCNSKNLGFFSEP